jgi:hypothetical protein
MLGFSKSVEVRNSNYFWLFEDRNWRQCEMCTSTESTNVYQYKKCYDKIEYETC